MTTATRITASGVRVARPRTKPFLTFVIDPALLAAVDDYRFAHRYPSRAAAVMALLRRGLTAAPDEASA